MRRGILRFSPALLRRSGAVTPDPPAAKTYADFQAHIATLATNGVVAPASGFAAGKYRTTLATIAEQLIGTSWQDAFRSAVSRSQSVIRHGLPDLATVNDQIVQGREVYFEAVSTANQAFVELDRNGLLSIAQASNTALRCTDLIYWDGTGAQRMNPFAGTGPTPYSF